MEVRIWGFSCSIVSNRRQKGVVATHLLEVERLSLGLRLGSLTAPLLLLPLSLLLLLLRFAFLLLFLLSGFLFLLLPLHYVVDVQAHSRIHVLHGSLVRIRAISLSNLALVIELCY